MTPLQSILEDYESRAVKSEKALRFIVERRWYELSCEPGPGTTLAHPIDNWTISTIILVDGQEYLEDCNEFGADYRKARRRLAELEGRE